MWKFSVFCINSMINVYPHTNPKLDWIPSPDLNFVIQSPLEKWEVDPSPLEIILSSILTINISVFLFIIVLFYLLISRYFLSSNKDFFFAIVSIFIS